MVNRARGGAKFGGNVPRPNHGRIRERGARTLLAGDVTPPRSIAREAEIKSVVGSVR